MAEDTQGDTLEIPVTFRVPDGMIAQGATTIVSQLGEKEVYINFFQIQPPFRFSTDTIPDKVNADCVARVMVSLDRFPGFVQALQTTLEQIRTSYPHVFRDAD